MSQSSTDSNYEAGNSQNVASWGPVHAWRTLGQLQAEEAIEPLLDLLKTAEDDWIPEEFPMVYSLIGPAAIPPLENFLKSQDIGWQRIYATRILEEIAKKYPEQRQVCIQAVISTLKAYRENEPDVNGMLIASLIHFKAVESAALIQEAYEAHCVDETICGDWEDVGIELGVVQLSEEQLQKRAEEKKKRSLLFQRLWDEQTIPDLIEKNTAINRTLQNKK
jgi:HEAT repeat protein